MEIRTKIFVLLLGTVLSSCGGGGGGSPAPAAPENDDDVNPTEPGDIDQSPGVTEPPSVLTGTDCAINLEDVAQDIPVTLTNGASECDYYAERDVLFTSTLTIEAGTTILMAANTDFSVRGGSINAVGSLTAPIRIMGEQRVQGYWSGMTLNDLRSSRLEHVQISDGGNNARPDSIQRDGTAGLLIRGESEIAIENISVSNSFNEGMRLVTESLTLSSFSGNRFYANALEGLVTESIYLQQLDESNDFSGSEQPNGVQAIRVADIFDSYGFIFMARDTEFELRNLGVPYYWGSANIDGTLTVQPGVTLALDDTARITVSGSLNLVGTADNPVTITAIDNNEPYDSIVVRGSMDAIYTTFEHGGDSTDGPALAEPIGMRSGLISLPTVNSSSTRRLVLESVSLRDSRGWAVSCSPTTIPESIIVSDIELIDNAFGDFSQDCGQ